jgi:hypothetical protein
MPTGLFQRLAGTVEPSPPNSSTTVLILVMSIAPVILAMSEVVDTIAMLPMEGTMRVMRPRRARRSRGTRWSGRTTTTHQAKGCQGRRD